MPAGIEGSRVKRHDHAFLGLFPAPFELVYLPKENSVTRGLLQQLNALLLVEAAAERSVQAVLEFHQPEVNGFDALAAHIDRVVVGTHHTCVVEFIAEWRHKGLGSVARRAHVSTVSIICCPVT